MGWIIRKLGMKEGMEDSAGGNMENETEEKRDREL
jgi:hypothetical protein